MSIAEAVAEGTLPGRVWIYSNYHCNLVCTYCLTESGPKVAKRELGSDRMLAIADEAAALGFTALGVTGGEPFLLPAIPDLLAKMSKTLPVVVLSNATLFTGGRLDQVSALAGLPVQIQVSLDSADRGTNDAERGRGNFDKVVEAIPALIERGVHVRVATTCDDRTDDDLERLCTLHRDLGVVNEDHVVRPVLRRGRAAATGMGVDAAVGDLPSELTITADGAFWSPFGPTVRGGRLDTDLLITRTTSPLSTSAGALLRLVQGRPQGSDTTLNIR